MVQNRRSEEKSERGNILIVDDDSGSLDLLSEILIEHGYKVRPSVSPGLGLESAMAEVPDLILLDVLMPEMDGYEVCRRLKDESLTRDVPVIFVSALEDPAEKVQGFKVGGVDFISKPFQPEEVLARVHTHLTLRRTQQSLQCQKVQLEKEVAERIRAEQALLESEERIQWIMDNAPAVIYVKNAEGKYQLVNKRFEDLFHLKRGEVVGKTDHDLFPAKVADALFANDRALLREGEARQLEELLLQDDGIHTYLSVKFPLRNAHGNNYALCGISSDITERKEAEAALGRAKEAAEAANRAKSFFVANMSHELRTPLNVILGFSQLLQRTPSLPPSASRHLKSINRSGEHLLALINDILEVSKIEAGCLSRKETTFNLQDLLRDIEEMFRFRTEQKGIAFHLETSGDIPQFLIGDAGKLRQILINLLGNAVKFTDQGGVVLAVLCTPRANNYWEIGFEVRDTGVGMEPEEMGRLFQPFEQTLSGKSRGGTGLGLTISKEYAALMGCDLSVWSHRGKGSTFRLGCTLKDSSHNPDEKRTGTRKVLGIAEGTTPKSVLVVDDREESRRLLIAFLRAVGFLTREAANGKEALDLFERRKPDLVLMDMRMPEMNGYEATHRMKAIDPEIPVIAISASVFDDEEERVFGAGCDDFIRKPFRENELFECVGRHLGIDYLYGDLDADGELFLSQVTPTDIGQLPETLRGELREALIALNVLVVQEILSEIEKHNAPLSQGMRRLVEDYQFERLLDLLNGGEDKNCAGGEF